MKIHNKLEIKTKDRVYTSFNNMLPGFVQMLSAGEAYSKYLAIGTGVVQTDINHLSKFETAVELVSDSYNFNPLNGQLFLRKKWVLAETNATPYEIVEVGLTSNEDNDNPKIANRFLVNGGEPIYRDAGEEMVFEITIYLDFDASSNLKLTAGDNALIKFFLGEGKEGDFFVARGYDDTDNETIVVRDGAGTDKVLVEPAVLINDDPPKIVFSFDGLLSPGGITEFLLFIGEEVVARQNVQNVFGGTTSVVVEILPDEDGVATLTTPSVESVSAVKNASSGEAVEGFSVIPYACGFQGAPEELFGGLGLPVGGRVLDSKTQDRLAFFDGDRARIFKMTDSGVEELDTSLINLSDGYLFFMFEDMFFVKCAHPDGTYSLRYYHYDTASSKYVVCNYYLSSNSYVGVNKEDYWTDMDGFRMDQARNNSEFMFVIVSENYIYGYKTMKLFGNALYNADTTMASGFKAATAVTMEPTNSFQNVIVCYAPSVNRMVYRKNYVYYTTDNAWATSIVRDYRDNGYPKVAKNHVYAVDDEAQIIKLFSIDSLTEKSIHFENAKNIYVDNALDYAVVKYNSGAVRAYYIDASRNIYEFMMSVPAMEDEIDKFYVVGDYFVFKLKNNKYFRIKLDKSKVKISPLSKGELFQVELMADTTPGSADSPLGFSASVSLLAVDEGGDEA